ncbi:MAG: potassium-transporting ATPase subunit KdpA [Planctomycetota bacterium]|nr:potassium-transporting ATPase subunit KdpA [Planctomycetota bacterium]
MTGNMQLQMLIYMVALLLLAKPLGGYMARVFEGKPCGLDRLLGPVERLIYRLSRISPAAEMTWKRYAAAVLAFSAAGFVSLYALQRLQGWLPLNPEGLPAVPPDLAFNTAVSFVTNTNWQAYGGEATMSYLTQMAGLAVHNFLSAATGMAVLAALIRGFARHNSETIGNFWADLVRSTLYVLLPLSLVLSLALVSQGVIQNFDAYQKATLVEPVKGADGKTVTEQVLPMGPVASQIAIKQLGTNGGGFFNTNSAHPYENPTPLSNFLEVLAILLIPAALCGTFGTMVGDTRQGWAILAAMVIVFVGMMAVCGYFEQHGTPLLAAADADETPGATQPGGNMEGKEVRFGITGSALWATATTAASNGSVNAMHDSFTPLGGLVPMWLMQLGEVIFGGVGSGLYGMLVFAILAVFVAGLMVGRTPEYLGKKIESFEMKMASVVILVPVMAVLVGTAVAVLWLPAVACMANPGPHGFSEVLYAFSSTSNNNGSAFAGLSANTPFYNTATGLAMLAGRFLTKIPVLAIAGALARKKIIPAGGGTLRTHGPLFVAMLIAVVIVVGALSFIPALALGPVVEHLMMH